MLLLLVCTDWRLLSPRRALPASSRRCLIHEVPQASTPNGRTNTSSRSRSCSWRKDAAPRREPFDCSRSRLILELNLGRYSNMLRFVKRRQRRAGADELLVGREEGVVQRLALNNSVAHVSP